MYFEYLTIFTPGNYDIVQLTFNPTCPELTGRPGLLIRGRASHWEY